MLQRSFTTTLSLIGLIVFIGMGTSALAQSQNQSSAPSRRPEAREVRSVSNLNVKEGEQASCSDYYTFGSVRLNLTQNRQTYSPGEPVIISGEMTNTNSYPLTQVDVVARVFKNHPKPNEYAKRILVDEYTVTEDVQLAGNQAKDLSSAWNIPRDLGGGTYDIQMYVTDHDRFNMEGLSFTENRYGQRLTFDVEGESQKMTYIDRGNIRVNGKRHDTLGAVTKHEEGKPITMKFPVVNSISKPQQMEVRYNLYRWDTQREANNLQFKTETITVERNSTKELAYTIENPQYPVLLADIKLKRDDEIISMSEIRFVVKNKGRPRIHSAGITQLPLKEDSEMFVCLHNTNRGNVPTQATATLTDMETDSKLAQINVEGALSDQIQGFVDQIQTDTPIDKARLDIDLKSQGKTVDSMRITYDCEQLTQGCSDVSSQTGITSRIGLYGGVAAIIVLIGSILGIGGYYTYKKKKNK